MRFVCFLLSLVFFLFFFIILLSPKSTLFPYTTLFRSLTRRILRKYTFKFLYAFWVCSEFPNRWRTSDRKSTRLNSSHVAISYAVFCLKKKTNNVCFGGLISY